MKALILNVIFVSNLFTLCNSRAVISRAAVKCSDISSSGRSNQFVQGNVVSSF